MGLNLFSAFVSEALLLSPSSIRDNYIIMTWFRTISTSVTSGNGILSFPVNFNMPQTYVYMIMSIVLHTSDLGQVEVSDLSCEAVGQVFWTMEHYSTILMTRRQIIMSESVDLKINHKGQANDFHVNVFISYQSFANCFPNTQLYLLCFQRDQF